MKPEDIEFQKVVMEGLVPQMAGSAVAVCITPEGDPADAIDAKFCVELGVMIMLDKPIIAVVQPGTGVSEKLRKVADEIVEVDIQTKAGQQELAERIKAFSARFEL